MKRTSIFSKLEGYFWCYRLEKLLEFDTRTQKYRFFKKRLWKLSGYPFKQSFFCCIIQLYFMFIRYFLYNLNANSFVYKLSWHQQIWLNYWFCNWLIADLSHFRLFLSFIQVSPFISITLYLFVYFKVILFSLNLASGLIFYYV